jgi:hypothetical protein
MKDFCVAMVKSVSGIDISVHSDSFQSKDYDGYCMWFVEVPYNGTMYRAVKVYPHSIRFYKDHPLRQSVPDMQFKIGAMVEDAPVNNMIDSISNWLKSKHPDVDNDTLSDLVDHYYSMLVDAEYECGAF